MFYAVVPTTTTEYLINGLKSVAPNVWKAFLIFLIGFVVIRILLWIAEFILSLIRMPKGLRGILESLIDGMLWVFLIIVILQSLGLDKLALVFSGSVAAVGLAMGAGASSLAADILSGVFLAKDRDFNVGDEVIAGEKPTQGVIESMDMRRTRIRSTDGMLHVIPNSVIERKEWVMIAKKRDRP